MVNAFFDVIDRVAESEGEAHYFVFNQRNTRVWPEAWIAFAHRSKTVRVAYSLGVVRFAEVSTGETDNRQQQDLDDPMFFESRAAAFAAVEAMKRGD